MSRDLRIVRLLLQYEKILEILHVLDSSESVGGD